MYYGNRSYIFMNLLPRRLASLLFCVCTSCVASLEVCSASGTYVVTFPQGTGTVITTPQKGTPTSSPYFVGFVSTGDTNNCGGGGDAPLGGNVECKGDIVAHFQWTPSFPGERRPDFLIIKERAVAQWTGTSMTVCDNGWGTKLGSASTTSDGYTMQSTDPLLRDRWVVMPNPGEAFDRTTTPHVIALKAAGTGGGGTGSGGTSVIGPSGHGAASFAPMLSGTTFAYYQVMEIDPIRMNLQGVQPFVQSSLAHLDSILVSQQLLTQIDMGGLADSHDTFAWTKPTGGGPVGGYTLIFAPPLSTKVVTGATSDSQLLDTVNGIKVGDTLHFAQANTDAKVLSIPPSGSVTLDRTVTTATNEIVTRAAVSSALPTNWTPPANTIKTSISYFTQPSISSVSISCTVYSGKMKSSFVLQNGVVVEAPTIKDSWVNPTTGESTIADKAVGQLALRNDNQQPILTDVNTTVAIGSAGVSQTLGSTNGLAQGDVLFFSAEKVYGTVVSVNATAVVLDAPISTTTGENVLCGPSQFVLDGATHPDPQTTGKFNSSGAYYDTWVETPTKYYSTDSFPGVFEWVQLVTDTSTWTLNGATHGSDGLQYLDDRLPYLGISSPSGNAQDSEVSNLQKSPTWLTFRDRPGIYLTPGDGTSIATFRSLGYSMFYHKQSFDLHVLYSGPLNLPLTSQQPIFVSLRKIPWRAFRQATFHTTANKWVLGDPESLLPNGAEIQNPDLPSWTVVKTSPVK